MEFLSYSIRTLKGHPYTIKGDPFYKLHYPLPPEHHELMNTSKCSLKCCAIFISIISFLIQPSFCDEPTNLTNLTSCFINHNIVNFTLYAPKSPAFSNLLDFSIQNLRFSGTSVPKPSAIVVPDNKEQLGKIVLCSRKWSFYTRVRSGGHSYEGISSSVADYETQFLIIDMMNLDKISIDLDSETAWVEGGATLGQTYYAIGKASRVHGFPAGACPTVGVGGHFSGGGFGYLARRYGVSADNVVDALLVDAEGRILDREGMGEDVFWAIRGGGGGNWGIIYAWKIRLVKVPEIVTAFTFSRTEGKRYKVAKLVETWQNVAPYLPDEFHIMVFISSGLVQAKGVSLLFQGLYQGPRTKAISILTEKFPDVGIVEGELKEMSWIESVVYLSVLNGELGPVEGLPNRYFDGKSYFKTKSDFVQKPISRSGIQIAIDVLEKEPKAYALLEPHGGFMQRTRSDSIAFPHRKGNLFSIEYTITWGEMDNVGEGKEYIDWIRGFYELMRPYVSSSPRAAYVNYMDLDLGVMELPNVGDDNTNGSFPAEIARVWGEKYFLKNYDRLVKAKTGIDPINIFRHEQSIPPIIQKQMYE